MIYWNFKLEKKMAKQYGRYGSCNLAIVKASASGQETLTVDVNGGFPFSIIGGYNITLAGSGGATLDVQIGGSTCLSAVIDSATAGTRGLAMSDTLTATQGTAGEDVTIVTAGGNSQNITVLFISQETPSSI